MCHSPDASHIIMADVLPNEALSRILGFPSCPGPQPHQPKSPGCPGYPLEDTPLPTKMPVAICALSWLSGHACILFFMHYHVTVCWLLLLRRLRRLSLLFMLYLYLYALPGCAMPHAPMELVTWKWVPHGVCVMHAYMLVNQRSRTEHILWLLRPYFHLHLHLIVMLMAYDIWIISPATSATADRCVWDCDFEQILWVLWSLSFDDDSCRFSYANAEKKEVVVGHEGSGRIFDIFIYVFESNANCFPLFLQDHHPFRLARAVGI